VGLFNHFIMKIEDLKRVQHMSTPEMGETFEMRLSREQAEQLTEKGYKVCCREINSQWMDKPIRVYYTEVKTEDLLKILPR
jgi:hypothetical protein